MKMKRLLLLTLTPLLLLALFAADASACSRCGVFGRGCRFNSHHAAAVVVADAGYAAPAGATTFNILNLNNGQLPLAGQGATVYGVDSAKPYSFSLAAQAYGVDPASVLNQAARLTTNAQALASDGLNGFNVTAQAQLSGQTEVAKILAQGQTATAALLAAKGADAAPAVTSFNFKASVENGQWKVESLTPAGAANVAALAVGDPLTTLVNQKCVACHGADNPKGGLNLSLLASADAASFKRLIERIEDPEPAKRMPKGQPPLSVDEKAVFYSRYQQLRAGK